MNANYENRLQIMRSLVNIISFHYLCLNKGETCNSYFSIKNRLKAIIMLNSWIFSSFKKKNKISLFYSCTPSDCQNKHLSYQIPNKSEYERKGNIQSRSIKSTPGAVGLSMAPTTLNGPLMAPMAYDGPWRLLMAL